jgi:hypothetical protein
VTASQQQSESSQQFVDADLTGARFERSILAGAVMRGVHVDGLDIDAPWLHEGGTLVVNGIDVAPYVNAELERRFPGRDQRFADDPDGLRAAWTALERAWASVVDRVDAMPPGTVDARVDGEWSFAQTLRHLVMATDTWLGRGILEEEQPYHPLGQPHAEYATDGYDLTVFASGIPAYADVLEARADRVARVRDYLATVTPDQLLETRTDVWSPEHSISVLACLHTILGEEWEHLRFAARDLDVLQAELETAGGAPPEHSRRGPKTATS